LNTVQRAIDQQERLLALIAELKKTFVREVFTHGLRHEPHKQTEFGSVPQSWEVVELGTIADLINGFAFKSEDYVAEGVLNFRVVNIRDEGVIDVSSDFEFLPNDFTESYRQYLLSEGDILVVMVGATRGKMAFITKMHTSGIYESEHVANRSGWPQRGGSQISVPFSFACSSDFRSRVFRVGSWVFQKVRLPHNKGCEAEF
jgi:restriction endonuclease S subunit